VVRRGHLDWRFKRFRFANFWHYILNAELPLFYENRDAYADIAGVASEKLADQEVLVRLSCVVNHGSGSYVYEGTPLDYFYDRSGGVEKVILRDVTYQKLHDFSSAQARPAGLASFVPRIRAGRPERLPEISAGNEAQPGQEVLSINTDVFVLDLKDAHNVGVEYIYFSQTAG
jgi:hypothetical protein